MSQRLFTIRLSSFRTLVCLLFIWSLPAFAYAQIVVSFPVSRVVFQRSANNTATLRINGYIAQPMDRIEARIQARNGQGTSSDWVVIDRELTGGTFSGDLPAVGGWYDLELRGIQQDQTVSTTRVERIGVGEVFIIAGQSNAQGMYDDMASAADDRVNAVNYYDQTQSAQEPSIDVLNRFSHLDQGGRIAPRGLGSWCWGKLGDLLAQRFNVPILFFNAGYEGTAIKNWRESAELGRTESIYESGSYYAAGQPYANLRVSLQFYTHMLGVRAVLWQQGEAEGFTNSTFDSYVSDLQTVINQSRRETGKAVAWVVARDSYSGDSRGARADIIRAQNQVIATVSNVFAGPNTDGIQIPRQRPPRTAATFDDVHFDVIGLAEVAQAWNTSLSDNFFRSASPFLPVAAPDISVSCTQNNQLALKVNGDYASVSWNSGETSQSITKGAGFYRAKVKDALGNVLITPFVRVAEKPTITRSGPTVFCEGDSVRLQVSVTGPVRWSTQSTNSALTVKSSGQYQVQTQDVSGCTFTSDPVSVVVNALPAKPTVTAAKTTTFCQGETTELMANEQAGYRWSTGETGQKIQVGRSGDYTVRVVSAQGCLSPSSDPLRVVVNPLPATPVITASGSTTFCADQQVTLTASAEQRYVWSSGQTTSAITINRSGTYTVRTQNEFSCFSALSTPVTIMVRSLPNEPTVRAEGPTVFCDGGQVVLTATSALPLFWTTGNTTRQITVKQTGDYSARVQDQFGCFSPFAPSIPIAVKPVPSTPTIQQVGTYTLEATGTLPGEYYGWKIDQDTITRQSTKLRAIRTGTYSAQAFIRYDSSLVCASAFSADFLFTLDETNQGLSIYPNPSLTKRITIETQEELTNAEIRIYTMTGQEVAFFAVGNLNEQKVIDLPNLSPGLYVLWVRSPSFSVAKRVLIGVGN